MRNDRAGIWLIPLLFSPINTLKEHEKRRKKPKKMKEREQGKKTRKFETGGFERKRKRE